MGLIKAGLGALGGTLADQWKEFFYCEALDKNVMVVKGEKRISGRSSNTKGSDNVISSGSGIAVADGQCMIIVEQGKIVEVCAEPGEFTYDSSSEPSIFSGNLGESVIATFKNIGKRFAYGGDPGKDQRVYYFNTKELIDNKFGTQNPIPFRVVDKNINLDIDISVRCNGTYSFKIVNPLLFYTNVCGNVETAYTRDIIESQLKTEFLSALQPAFAKISEMGIRYSAVPGHTLELSKAMNELLTAQWTDLRGLAIVMVGINSITAPKEDEELIKTAQRNAMMRDPSMAGATLVAAQADAMKAAAANEGGAMTGFMGLGMAQNAGGMNAQNLFAMGQQQQQQQPVAAAAPAASAAAPAAADSWTCECGVSNTGKFCLDCGKPKPAPKPAADSWTCECGAANTGKFCLECGKAKPAPAPDGWTCACGVINKGKFCAECGTPKPAAALLYACDKCGWQPVDPTKPPKFCPECGDLFDESDAK
jgi:Putative virion core protein (lumpy skin disease virus)